MDKQSHSNTVALFVHLLVIPKYSKLSSDFSLVFCGLLIRLSSSFILKMVPGGARRELAFGKGFSCLHATLLFLFVGFVFVSFCSAILLVPVRL